jgi:hypothetical protein
MGFFKDVAEHLGAVDKNLLAKGILARGDVVSIEPTGMSWGGGGHYGSISSTTVCRVTVKVIGLKGHEPYEATALVPIGDAYIPEFQQPGATIAVRVNPTDPTDIAYDLQHDVPTGDESDVSSDATAEAVATKDGAQIVLQSDDGTEVPLTTHVGKLTAAQVLEQGLPCTVDVLTVIPLDQTNARGEVLTGLILNVRRAGKPDVQAQIGTHIPQQFVMQVTPGASLPARFTPGLDVGDNTVVPDWSALKV